MSSTLRDATERTVHSLTDLVGDAMQHIDLPHIDLARASHRRRSLSPVLIVAIGAAIVLFAVFAARAMRARASNSVEAEISPADWLADSEVAVTSTTPDPLAESLTS